jgi:adenylate cyclase
MFVLTIHEGGASREYPLKEGETLIGRGPHCDIVLGDDSISRNHARIVIRGDSFVVADLGSSNGTYCDGEPVTEHHVTGDERLMFGTVEAAVTRAAASEPPPPGNPTLLVAEQRVRRVDELPGASDQVAALDAPRLIRLLGETGRVLIATLPLEDILTRVIDLLVAHVPTERASLLLADPVTGELVPRIVRHPGGAGTPQVISRTLIDMVLKHRVAVLTSDVRLDPRFDGSQSIFRSDVRSLLCGPLYAGDEIIGVLYADNPVTRQLSESDLEVFTALANYAAVAISQARLAEQLREESRRRERLARYHSPAVVDRVLARESEDGEMRAQERDLSVLFVDIVGFTTLAEHLTPTEVSSLLNTFFSRLTDVIFEEEGTVDKFIGDAILAVFGAPLDQPDHAIRAVRAAQGMRKAVAVLNAEGVLPPLRVKYAIHSGVAIAGDVGSNKRREYTVIGDVVNTAARLEKFVEPDQIVISQATYERLQAPFEARSLGVVPIRGRSGQVQILSVDN